MCYKNLRIQYQDDETLEKLDIHLDISRTIIDDIIPYHLEFYLGVRKDELGAGDLDDDDMDDDENVVHLKIIIY